MQRPEIVEFEITTACNYSCRHCYCNAGKKSRYELTTQEAKKVIKDLVDAGVKIIDIVGGEPFLRPDLEDIILYGRSLGARMMINTNGSLATWERVKKLKEIDKEILIGVSLDGHIASLHEFVRGKNTFQRTMEGLMNFLKAGFEVTILHVINARNYSYFENMVLFAKKLGVNLYVDRFVPVGRGELYKDELLPTRKMIKYVQSIIDKYRNDVVFYVEENIKGGLCTAGRTHASILVDGTVVPCGHFRFDKEFYMGNIKNKSFGELWKSYDSEILIKDCKECLFFNKCYGGCRAFAYKINKKIDPIFCLVGDQNV
ncbi:radical SAM protein [Thermosipho ferrireducens]|uniref:Radical SAM protein n=1 Tax=Thermosipho ferrireducens TaxID=2571116 RepID=A0ABX7S7K8_9BACT|nr:radical SAM protein [Thermosipho ferrireducens]QTA37790.1 radical SAM protein [Thermosipho ferrireducens]